MPEFVRQIPQGDNRERLICPDCGHIAYENPKVVVGSVVIVEGGGADQVLLCRRAINPRLGYWTLPAGFLELGETTEEGAVREALEEANAHIAIDGVLAFYSLARIGQVQIIFRASFAGPVAFNAGDESLEVRLFTWDEIPWAEIAFPSVHWALREWHRVGNAPLTAPAGNPMTDPRGMGRLERIAEESA